MKYRVSVIAGIAAAVLLGCGGGGDDDGGGGGGGGNNGADAGGGPGGGAIAGGGVGGEAIDGALRVFVLDENDAPIAGATVVVGDLQGTTDGDGLAAFADSALSGTQTVTAHASGRAASTFVGVNRDLVTLPLAPYPRADVATATVSGTIAGWDDLPSPTLTRYNAALVMYSFTGTIGDRENSIEQPMSGGEPANLCVQALGGNSDCNWRIRTRTGPQVHYAVIVRGNTNGSPSNTDDDTYELLGYAMLGGLDIDAGANITGETLAMVEADLVDLTASIPGAAGGLGDPVALPMVDLGAEGQMVFPLPTLSPGNGTTQVPSATGAFAGARHHVVGLASPGGDATHPFSTSFRRDVTLGATVTLPSWLPAPGALSGSGDTYSFSPASGASLHVATLVDGGGDPAWSVLLLDGTTSFSLPALDPDPLPQGNLTLRVAAAELPGFEAASFSLATFDDDVVRVSEAEAAISLR